MWSDKESDSDYLNFGEVSQLAVDILTSPGMLPVSLGVFGNWGAGKSSLLKLIDKDLRQGEGNRLLVNFDAWMYQGYDDARAALLEVIARELNRAAKGNESLLKKTKGLLDRVNVFRALGLIAEGTALAWGVPTGGLLAGGISAVEKLIDSIKGESEFSVEDYQGLGKRVKDAGNQASGLLKPETKATPPQQIDAFRREYGEILKELGKPLIVMIDNLDRCLPANAIHTLEAIRLFVFLPNTAFVIAADEEMIRGAVAEYFKGTSARHQIDYLDKLIQVPIRVPKSGVREIRSYLFMLFAIENGVESENLERLRQKLEESLQQSWQAEPISKGNALSLTGKPEAPELVRAYDLADRIAPILATSPLIQGNPRTVKRLLNVVKMRAQIARRRKMPLDESIITKLVIFERCAGAEATTDLYRRIDAESGKPGILAQLEDNGASEIPGDAPDSWKNNPTTKEFILKWSQLDPPLKAKDLRAAVYLSRETMPIGSYVVGLSPKGREALQVLVGVSKISSPAGKAAVEGLPLEDQVSVMEGIIDNLRQVPDWGNQPKGFAGACLLARQSPEAALVLKRFVVGIEQPIWMKTMLKSEQWFKE
jgi:predicted KAP-like P-loop ATPase